MIKKTIYTILLLIFWIDFNYAQEWILYSSSTNNIPSNQVNSIFIDANNIKWFGTDSGLVSFDGVNWYTHSIVTKINCIENGSLAQTDQLLLSSELGAKQIKTILADSIVILDEYQTDNSDILSDICLSSLTDEGDVHWIGTDSGLSILDGLNFINLTDEDWKLPHNVIPQIRKRLDGFNYLATQGGGVARLKYNNVDGITSASVIDGVWSQLPSDTINALYFDSDNNAWYGTSHGLSKHIGNDIKSNWNLYTSNDGLPNDTVLSITGDLSSNIWVGTANGISRFSGDEWDTWSTSAQSAGNSILSISQDHDGSMWICTNDGILNFDPPATSVYEQNRIKTNTDINLRVHPNPFNSTTNIHYTITKKSNVELRIFNLLGKLVTTLVSRTQNPNNYTLRFNMGNLPSGIYYCRLSTGSKNVVKRMLNIK